MVNKPKHHILVCNSFRAKGEPKGVCFKQGGSLLQYMETEILDRGLDILITGSGCLKQCEDGPVMIVYPEAWWYGKVDSEEKVDEILDALENGEPCEDLLI
ncbi:MAG: (2Fe-2S) ferredoxin domain-containing protein [Thermodesulfobacteriota bacterium]